MPATVYIYNENCVMAGRAVPVRELDRYDDPNDGADWHSEEVTEENAASHDDGNDYHRRIAATIRACL